jgi:anti-anti-sigma factor
MEPLLVRQQQLAGAICLVLTGELDLAGVSVLQSQFRGIAHAEDHVIVDMGGLRYIDSSGAKVLLEAQRSLSRRNRRLVLAAVQPLARRVIDIMGLERIIPIFPTVEAAIEDLNRKKGTTDKPGDRSP